MGGADDRADPRRVHVGRDHHAVVVHALGRGHRLAAGRGRDVEHAFTRLRIERGHDGLACLGPAARRARRARRRARRDRRCDARAARPARADRLRHRPRAPRSSAAASVTGRAHRIHAERDCGRLVVERRASPARRRRRARRRSVCTIQSGWDVRMPIAATSSPAGSGHGGPSRATDRSTPLAKPARPFRHDADRLTHRGVRRDAGVSWYAPTRNAARTRGSSDASGRDDTRARRWSRVRCRRSVP